MTPTGVRRFRPIMVFLAALAAAGWLLVAPTQLGGATDYVVTHGVSMEPRFHTGDLAVLRTVEHYQVGDVAAYHSVVLDTVVMHRIVAINHGRYTFQGDNNSWRDPDHPTRDQLIGRLASRIPQGGIWLDRFSSPTALGLFAFGLLAGGTAAQTTRRRKRRTVTQHAQRTRRVSVSSLPAWVRTLGIVVAVAATSGVVLAVPAWTTPASLLGASGDQSAATMTFSYRTEVRRSAAYDGTVVTSPDPVFRKLANTVDVRYSYHGRPGTITVAAKLSSAGGWHSTVPLRPRVSFNTDHHTGTVRLDLNALENRAQAAANVTGIPTSQVDIAVVPSVRSLDGTTFEPRLALALSPLQLTLVGDKPALTVRNPTTAETGASIPGTLSFAGHHLPVATARTLSLVLMLGGLLGGLVLGLVAYMRPSGREGAAIRSRYAPLLIQVQPMPAPTGRPIVDVVDFPTLAKLAQRYGLLVMHWSRADVETFMVHDEGTTYRYRTGIADAGVPIDTSTAPVAVETS
jgi:signal peptidase I